MTRSRIVAASVHSDLIHLDERLRIDLGTDLILILGRGEVSIVIRVASGIINLKDVFSIQEVGEVDIHVEEHLAALLAFLVATECEVEVLVNTEVDLEGGGHSGTVVGTSEEVVTTRDRRDHGTGSGVRCTGTTRDGHGSACIGKQLDGRLAGLLAVDDGTVIFLAGAEAVVEVKTEVVTTVNTGREGGSQVRHAGVDQCGSPDKQVVEKYFSADKPYFIIRFAKLNAHHDNGIKGIDLDIASRLVEILKPHGDIYITSERSLEPQLEPYRIKIDPIDIHHVMAFASLYIGDSQTMAAEAGVLGVPFVRYNDFVGRIGYLNELENKYHLGFGIKASDEGSEEKMYQTVKELLALPDLKGEWQSRRQIMLSEKIDYARFLTWFFENYPESHKIMKENPDYQFRFR